MLRMWSDWPTCTAAEGRCLPRDVLCPYPDRGQGCSWCKGQGVEEGCSSTEGSSGLLWEISSAQPTARPHSDPTWKGAVNVEAGGGFPPPPVLPASFKRPKKCKTIMQGTQEGWAPRGLPFFTPYWDSATPACHPSTCSPSSAIRTFEAPCSSIPSTHRPKGYSR